MKRVRSGEVHPLALGREALEIWKEEEKVDRYIKNEPDRSREEVYYSLLRWKLEKILKDYKDEKSDDLKSINLILKAFRFLPKSYREDLLSYKEIKI